MTKEVLSRYVAAKKELALVEQELRQYHIVTDTVTASMTEFPYIKQTITIQGIRADDRFLKLLADSRLRLKKLRKEVEEFLQQIEDPFISAAIRMHYLQGKRWHEVAMELGGSNTDESIKKMISRYLNKTQSKGA